MAIEQSISLTATIGGTGYTVNQDGSEYTSEVDIDFELGTAWAGVLTTRTDDNTGTLTMDDAGHDIATGNRLDLYWTIDGVNYCQRGITVGTVSGTSVPFDSGVGDNLPTAATEITAMVPTLWTGSVVEANIEAFAAQIIGTEKGAQVAIGASSFTEQAAFLLNGVTWTGDTAAWSDGVPGWTSPISAATTFTQIYVSHGDAENEATFRMRIAID